ncbi:hypothetical protein K1719_013494 [Acacia pycnantha]|nr:hypothetical protein K1719_013494 [Acacia pycnantha]
MFKQGVVDPSNRLSSWSSLQDCCLWQGVECDDDRVVGLDLQSYNNSETLRGTQLQTFEAWSYTGNPELCGPPLQKNCTLLEKPDNREQVEGNDDDAFLKSLYLGMGIGFAVGFWVVCGSLFLNRAWRHTYFGFFDGVIDRIYVIVAVKLRRFH